MPKKSSEFALKALLILLVAASSCGRSVAPPARMDLNDEGPAYALRLVSYNILSSLDVGSIFRGYLPWELRRGMVAAFLKESGADLIALQEAAPDQLHWLQGQLDLYAVAHALPKTTDALLLYRRDRFHLVSKGFWSLPTFESYSQQRLAVWARLLHKDSGREVLAVATHLDARRRIKRKAAHKLRHDIEEAVGPTGHVVLLGDFNLSADMEPFKHLLEGGFRDSLPLSSQAPTFPTLAPLNVLDHILYRASNRVFVNSASVIHPINGRLMSDHFPIEAELLLLPPVSGS